MEVLNASLQAFLKVASAHTDPLLPESTQQLIQASQRFSEERRDWLREWFRESPVSVYVSGSLASSRASPYSDVDLVFLMDDEAEPEMFEDWVAEKVYPLYTWMGRVGHAFRKRCDLAKITAEDQRVYYTLREARNLWNHEPLDLTGISSPPRDVFLKQVRRRWDRYAFSPCLVEMNVKESPGALLDHINVERLNLGREDGELDALHALLALRIYLHSFHKRALDELNLRVLRSCSKESVHRLYRATVKGSMRWLTVLDPDVTFKEVTTLEEWFSFSQSSKRQFNYSYLNGGFDRLFPPMTKRLFDLSESSSHRYTVGWHASECVKIAKDLIANVLLPAPPHLELALKHVDSAELLYLAVFLHDIGKAEEGDHSVWGAEYIQKNFQDQLTPDEIALVSWLILHHLEFHRRAMKEDILDPAVIRGTAEWVGSRRKLSALYLLTIVDLVGTNRSLWSTWRAQILGNFYSRVMNELSRMRTEEKAPVIREQVPTVEAAGLVQSLPQEYRLTRSRSSMMFDLKTLEALKSHGFQLGIHFDSTVGFDVIVLALKQDCFGVLASLLDKLFEERIGVWRTRTYKTDMGLLDLIWIYPYDGAELKLREGRSQRLQGLLEATVAESLRTTRKAVPVGSDLLKERMNKLVEGAVTLDYDESRHVWHLTVTTRDREGLLRDLVHEIYRSGFNIDAATIGTTGDTAIDHFVLT